LFQDQGPVASRTQLVQFVGFHDDMLAGGIFVAVNDGVGFHRAVSRAVLLVAEALTAAGMQEMEVRRGRSAAHSGISLDRNGDQTDPQ
jgi:hypothetical protein